MRLALLLERATVHLVALRLGRRHAARLLVLRQRLRTTSSGVHNEAT